MPVDVRTVYITAAACYFMIAAGLFFFQPREFQRYGIREWIVGQILYGAFWALMGLRGIIPDFISFIFRPRYFIRQLFGVICGCPGISATPLPPGSSVYPRDCHRLVFPVLLGLHGPYASPGHFPCPVVHRPDRCHRLHPPVRPGRAKDSFPVVYRLHLSLLCRPLVLPFARTVHLSLPADPDDGDQSLPARFADVWIRIGKSCLHRFFAHDPRTDGGRASGQ